MKGNKGSSATFSTEASAAISDEIEQAVCVCAGDQERTESSSGRINLQSVYYKLEPIISF